MSLYRSARATSSRRTRTVRSVSALAVSAGLVLALAACSDDTDDDDADPTSAEEVDTVFDSHFDESGDAVTLADSVTIPSDTELFKTSGMGPEALNEDADEDDPMAYIDPSLLVDGELPDGMSMTEAQGLQVLSILRGMLQEQGLDVQDVATMRVFVAPEEGEDPDFDGWNRAYSQYFANTDLRTGDPQQLSRGTSEETSDPLVINPTRPTRYAIGVVKLPVEGWLVEAEVDVVYDPDDVDGGDDE